jgi:thymidylate synthase
MTKVYSGSNPGQLYMNALIDLIIHGRKYSPRGKDILELRPVVFEYTNPRNRVTFLNGRVINPFFQLAEALWIVAGRSDVSWLTDYNKSIAQFSDDGHYFNAPYGERIRYWGKNDARGYVYCPHDQLVDVYNTLTADNDTRQAYVSIWNPVFDNGSRDTRDRACNVGIDFKLRDGALDITVFNRSNDLHWGTFGANLCQFATIQEVMASWLGVEVGTYCQITNSLHVYTDSYGAKETQKIISAYKLDGVDLSALDTTPAVAMFKGDKEPRMTSNMERMTNIISYYFNIMDGMVRSDAFYEDDNLFENMISEVGGCTDDYWRMTIFSMIAYQAHKRKNFKCMVIALENMQDCSWKISCLRFLSKTYAYNLDTAERFKALYDYLPLSVRAYIDRIGE